MARNRGLRVGIALGKGEVVGLLQEKSALPPARVPVQLPGGGADPYPELARAFQALREALEASGSGPLSEAEVHLTLLPPLVDVRLVSLPPMHEREMEAVLNRDVSRHFLGGNGPRIVGIRAPNGKRASGRGGEAQSSVSVLAAAAPLRLLEGATSALADLGWVPRSFTPAQAGWLSAARTVRGTPISAVVGLVDGTAHVVRLDDGDPVAIRQLPVAGGHELSHALGMPAGRALVLGSLGATDGAQGVLEDHGWAVYRDPAAWPGAAEAAAARAAPGGLELVPPTLAQEREGKRRRTIASLLVAAVVLFLASTGAHLWGEYRELGAVRDQRAAIRAQVAPLMDARDSLNLLRDQIAAVEEIDRTAPLWTRALVELSALLPRSTYLTGFFASGDTVEIEAAGTEAAQAIQLLRGAGLFQELRLQGIVERELEDGETVEERFRLRARLPTEEGGHP